MPSLTGSPRSTSTSTPTFSGVLRVALQDAPSRIPLHPYGEFVGNGILFVFDEESLRLAREDLQRRGVPWVLDFHHQTLQVQEGTAQEAPAAGFVVDVEVGDDGFVYGVVEWSETGRERVARGEYAYVSPVFYYEPTPDEQGRHRVLGYHSFALTNTPGIRFQKRIEAEADMLERLRRTLGLGETATEEEVFQALEDLKTKAEVGRVALEVGMPAQPLELKATLLRLLAAQDALEELEKARQELARLRTEALEEKAQALVRAALEEGRVLPHQREFWLMQARADLEATRKALEGLPRLVPTELPQLGAERRALERDPAEEIRRRLGVSDEAWRKYGGD